VIKTSLWEYMFLLSTGRAMLRNMGTTLKRNNVFSSAVATDIVLLHVLSCKLYENQVVLGRSYKTCFLIAQISSPIILCC
jgi:hypothetical protein